MVSAQRFQLFVSHPVVRPLVGYERFDTDPEYQLFQSISPDLHLFTNIFQLLIKNGLERAGGQNPCSKDTRKPSPLFRGIKAAEDIPLEAKARSTQMYIYYNECGNI